MSRFETLPPHPDLLESMRAVGYSLPTAIADLIDNSISAQARNVRIQFTVEPAPFIYIQDDGSGMAEEELRTAMKLAGKPPTLLRAKEDLGRFGLGLKTASLSQCRRLVVVSKKQGQPAIGAVWDLDNVASKGTWSLEWLEVSEVTDYLAMMTNPLAEQGTVVFWQQLDLLFIEEEQHNKSLSLKMETVADHISLVFHRYLGAVGRARLTININGLDLEPLDPFFSSNSATQVKTELIKVGSENVKVTSFILPHINRMSEAERKQAKRISERFRETQGFYIYRQKRLLTYGTWFRLTPKSEMSKFARVMVDTPNTLDLEWRLGVTKSSVEPPASLRKALTSLVPSIVSESEKIAGKVKKSKFTSTDTIWTFTSTSKDSFRLSLNFDNTLMRSFSESLNSDQLKIFQALVEQVEDQFPIQEVVTRVNGDQVFAPGPMNGATMLQQAQRLFEVLILGESNISKAFDALLAMEPFSTTSASKKLILENRSLIIGERTDERLK